MSKVYDLICHGHQMKKVDLKNLMCQIDPTLNDHEIDVIFKKFDSDNSGEISKKEFLDVII